MLHKRYLNPEADAMHAAFKRIKDITLADVEANGKSCFASFASVVEELGEVARALKVEQGVAGSSGKILDESAASELCDLLICGIFMYVVFDGTLEEPDRDIDDPNWHSNRVVGDGTRLADQKAFRRLDAEDMDVLKAPKDPFQLLAILLQAAAQVALWMNSPHCKEVAASAAIQLAKDTITMIYQTTDHDETWVVERMNEKLDKWAKNLNVSGGY